MAVADGTLLAGRYRVLERLGSGGMATVFLAEDERLGRKVAVKRLHAHSPKDAARRFEREAKLGASLSHPNLATIFDTAADDEGVLIVMEYVEGDSLAAVLADEGALAPERAIAVVSAVAAALDRAHEDGVVHRDVKPANILITPTGGVKLVDLGIATAAERTQITSAGTVLGTPAYMAPEQLEGGELTSAVDVYALAAVAYEILTGAKARSGRTPVEIAHRVSTSPPPDLREALPGAPPAAAEALRRGMAVRPEDRPPTAGALARELERAWTGAAHAAPPPTAPTVPVRRTRPLAGVAGPGPPRRRRLPRGPVLVAAALVLLVAAGAVAAIVADDPAERVAPVTPPTAAEPAAGGDAPADAADGAAAGEDEAAEGTPAAPEAGGPDAGRQAHLEGHRALLAGDNERAIDLQRQAIAALEGSGRPEYWYAHFDLGVALARSGRPAEAIPHLERRLEYPENRGVVRRELAAARKAARGDE